jgi:hypothetical protein
VPGSHTAAVTSGRPRFKCGNNISGVLGVIAAQRLELGAEPLRAQRIQELLDERVVEVVFEDDNIVAYLLQRHKPSPNAVAMAAALTPASARPAKTSRATSRWLKTTWSNPCTAVNGMCSLYRACSNTWRAPEPGSRLTIVTPGYARSATVLTLRGLPGRTTSPSSQTPNVMRTTARSRMIRRTKGTLYSALSGS